MESKSNSVSYFILDKIKNGELNPGDTLNERKMAKELGISRTPVREAFRKLEQDGVLVFEPYKGVKIVEIDLEKVIYIFQVREAMERLAVRICSQMENSELVEYLTNLLIKAEEEIEHSNIDSLRKINYEFHNSIAKFTKNYYLISILDNLRTHINIYMARSLSKRGRPAENIHEHMMIIEAISSKDPDLAEAAMKFHINQSKKNLLNTIDEEKH